MVGKGCNIEIKLLENDGYNNLFECICNDLEMSLVTLVKLVAIHSH